MPHVSKNANFSEKGIKHARLATLKYPMDQCQSGKFCSSSKIWTKKYNYRGHGCQMNLYNNNNNNAKAKMRSSDPNDWTHQFLTAAIAYRSSNGPSCYCCCCCWWWWWGNFVRPLDDLVAKSTNNGTNNLGRSQNCENPDLKKFLPVTNPFQENHPKRFKLQF